MHHNSIAAAEPSLSCCLFLHFKSAAQCSGHVVSIPISSDAELRPRCGKDRVVRLKNVLQARSEVYLGHLRAQLCFLPGIPWLQLGRRVLPEGDVQELATSIRRVARLLWAVHLSFQQGFDVVSRVSQTSCPPGE